MIRTMSRPIFERLHALHYRSVLATLLDASVLPLVLGCAPLGNLLLWRREFEWCFSAPLALVFSLKAVVSEGYLGSAWIWWLIEGCQL